MKITYEELRHGDIILFKGSGPVFWFFSLLLCLLEPGWRKLNWRPWHMAVAWDKTGTGWQCFEGYAPVSRLHTYTEAELRGRCRFYRRLDPEPSYLDSQTFLINHVGKPYDVAVYFFTSLGYLLRHYWGKPIPYFMDNRFSCWELVYHWQDDMGQPLAGKYDFPLITDFLKVVGEIKG